MDKKIQKIINYKRISDIVKGVYIDYLFKQANAYGGNNIDSEMLAKESILLVLDIFKNNPDLSDEDIRDLAIKEASVLREWN